MTKRGLKRASTWALAYATAWTAVPAQAQEAGSAGQRPGRTQPAQADIAPPEDEIVVTGFALSEANSIANKRETFIVSDSVSADDIGRLPDQNTAAALRRIPGVSVQEDQGEPRFPVIRGLPSTYNRTQINGAIVASVDNAARTVPLDIVPSSLAARLEVYKTLTPDLDPNAIGGTINIVTRSAFDEEGFFFNGTGAVTFYEQAGDVRDERLSWRANATAGTRFGPDGQFGIIGTISYQIRDSDIPQVETAAPSYREYTAAGAPVNLGAPTGNDVPVPVQRRLFIYNNVRERLGGALALEWQPDPSLYVRLFGTYNRMEDDEVRHENRLEQSGNVTNQTPTSGTFVTARNVVGLGRFQINRTIWNGQFNARWDATPELRIDLDAIYSGAELDNPESTEEFATPANATFGFNYDTSNFFFQFNPINPAAIADPANYNFTSRSELQRGSQEDVYEGRAAVTWRRPTDTGEISVKAGGVYRRTDRINDQDVTGFTLPAASGLTYRLSQVFERRPVPIVGGYVFDLIIDSQGAEDFFQANRARFTGVPNNVTADFEINETIHGGYLQVGGRVGEVQAIAGMRYERTDVDAIGTSTVNGVNVPANNSGGYDAFLPSIHLRWNATPRLVLRGAYWNALGRPDFASIVARETISFGTTGIPSLSRGNPDLRPRRSEALDASVEYYTRGGLVAVGVFFKDIKDEIFTLTSVEALDVGRGIEQVQVSQPQNAQSARLVGVEAAVQQTFTFLPAPFNGLGVNLNATYINSDLEVLTPAGPRQRGFFLQPEWTANAQLFFTYKSFEARVAYNYIGGFLETINGTIPQADQFWDERAQLDAQVRYRLTRNILLFVEGENLTNAGRRELTGPNRDLLQEAAEYGRTFSAGASVTF